MHIVDEIMPRSLLQVLSTQTDTLMTIALNRASKLNSLSLGMIRLLWHVSRSVQSLAGQSLHLSYIAHTDKDTAESPYTCTLPSQRIHNGHSGWYRPTAAL